MLLAGLSIGSMAGGFIYGARNWPGRPGARLVVTLLGAAVTFALLALAGSRPALALLLVLVGLLAGPVGVICSTLLDTVAPRGTMTEAFAAMVMGIVVGIALGQALGGTRRRDAVVRGVRAARGRGGGGRRRAGTGARAHAGVASRS